MTVWSYKYQINSIGTGTGTEYRDNNRMKTQLLNLLFLTVFFIVYSNKVYVRVNRPENWETQYKRGDWGNVVDDVICEDFR